MRISPTHILRCRFGSKKVKHPLFKVRDANGRQHKGHIAKNAIKREGVLVTIYDQNPDLERRGMVRVAPVGTGLSLTVEKSQIFKYRPERYE